MHSVGPKYRYFTGCLLKPCLRKCSVWGTGKRFVAASIGIVGTSALYFLDAINSGLRWHLRRSPFVKACGTWSRSFAPDRNFLYQMGFRPQLRRSTLADANEVRDWRLGSEPDSSSAQTLRECAPRSRTRSSRLFIGRHNHRSLLESVSVAPFFAPLKGPLNSTHSLDPRGPIPTFPAQTESAVHEINILGDSPIIPGANYLIDRGQDES